MFRFPQNVSFCRVTHRRIWFPIGNGGIEIIDLVLSDGFKDFTKLTNAKLWRGRSLRDYSLLGDEASVIYEMPGITVQGNQINLRIYKIPKIIIDGEQRTMVQLE